MSFTSQLTAGLREPDIQRQELACTNCNRYVQFNMDFALDGNHEITCPKCGHVHYRVVRDGKITEDRWQSSAGATYTVGGITASTSSYLTIAASSTTGNISAMYMSDLWLQSTGQ